MTSQRFIPWRAALIALLLALVAEPRTRASTNYIGGYLYGAHSWQATNTYILTNFVYVMGNSSLDIEAGTVIQATPGTGTTTAANDFGSLFVCRGAKLNAIGTPYRPIIFTSVEDDVSDPGDLAFPTRGRWGGVVLFGNARLNNPSFTTNSVPYEIFEGLPDISITNSVSGQVDYIHRFGGDNDQDNSGTLRFVSVRHGGKKLETDKEVNGFSFGAVGSGTHVDFLETYCIADDGFEFFGGSVNTKHLISAFNDDDAFDTDEGYNGKNQFWFAIHEPNARDEGGEINGQPNAPDVLVQGATPVATHELYNATFIGGGTSGSGNDSLNIRRASFSRWYNSIFTEFQGVRVNIDGSSQPDIRNNLFWKHAAGDGAPGNGTGYGTTYCPAELNPIADPQLRGIGRTQDGLLDPRPLSGSPAFSGFKATPADGFYSAAPYKGAFSDQDNWAANWTALDACGHLPARDNEVTIGGYLSGIHHWSATNVYLLTNFTYVLKGAQLHIEPGTVIKGMSGTGSGTTGVNDFGCLFVCRGGKLFAEGTANNPIIFTTEEDDVADPGDLSFPTRGRWGGIVLFGNARINNPSFTTNSVNYELYEGLPDIQVPGAGDYIHRFGGDDDEDSSGVLRYVSVRHGGRKLETDKEVNGVSLCGVGRGTTLDFVEAFSTADDGFEFFGGSVNTRHLISAYNDDDSFDTDQGYNGKNQFWFAIQEPITRDEGGEINGQPNAPDVLVDGAQPLATHELFNGTFIGGGSSGSGNDSLNIRRGSFSRWFNNIFTGFQGVRVNIDGISAPVLENNLFWDHAADAGTPGSTAGNGTGYGTAHCPAALNPIANPKLLGIDRSPSGHLDPRIPSDSPARTGYRILSGAEQAIYTPAPYKGAFGDNNWAQDWSALSQMGFLKSSRPVQETQVTPPPSSPTLDFGMIEGSLRITFTTQAGRAYQIQSRDTAEGSPWESVGTAIEGTGSAVSVSVTTPASSQRFVRVEVR